MLAQNSPAASLGLGALADLSDRLKAPNSSKITAGAHMRCTHACIHAHIYIHAFVVEGSTMSCASDCQLETFGLADVLAGIHFPGPPTVGENHKT